jgi:hypothetical protein
MGFSFPEGASRAARADAEAVEKMPAIAPAVNRLLLSKLLIFFFEKLGS